MSLDIIKSYLVSIGFNIDNASLNNTQQKMNQAEKTVKSFAKNNSNSVASMQHSTSDIGMLTRTSMDALAKIFPVIKGPLNQVMNHINLVKQVFNAFSKSVKKDMSEADSSVNKFQSGTAKKATTVRDNVNKFKSSKPKSNKTDTEPNYEPKSKSSNKPKDNKTHTEPSKELKATSSNNPVTNDSVNDISKACNTLITTSSETGTALETFEAVGSTAIEGLSLAALGPLALIAAAIAAIAIATVALTKLLGDLARQDLGYQKLARQLWTTKQNAKEISMALKTMGATMQDLWLSPQLLAQFNQLRKDSAGLKLPDSFNKNIAVVQGLGFEFQRLKQAGTLAFQWLGSYILEYIAGPLYKIKVGLHNFNDGFLKAIPNIAKVIAIPIGVIARLFLDLAQVVGFLGKTWGKTVHFIGSLLGKIPEKVQNIIKIIGLLALVIFSPLAAIVGLILIFDDLMTAIKGGKSVIGDWGKDFKDKVGKAALPFIKLWETIKGFYTNIKKGAGDIAAPFIAFGEKVQSVFEDIGEFIDDIKKKINSIVKPIANAVNAVKGTPDNVVNAVKGAPGNIFKAAQGIPEDIFSAFKGAGDKISALSIQSKVNYAVPSVSSTKNTNSTSSSIANSNNKSSNTNTFHVYGTNPTSTASAIGKTLTGINIRNLQGVY